MNKLKLNIQMFSASASKSTTTYSPASSTYGYTLTASFVENSTDVANNSSSVTCTATLNATQASFNVTNAGTLSVYWYDNKNKQDVLIASQTISSCGKTSKTNYGPKSVSGTYTAYHNDDGTLSADIKAVWTKNVTNNYVPKTASVITDTATLTYIPRTSSVSSTNANIGANPTITIAKSSSSFTHTLRYYFTSDVQGTIVSKTSSSSYNSWALPTTLYAKIPSQNSINGTIYCDTYSGTTLIGTSSCSITANVPSSATPTVNLPTLSDATTKPSGLTNYVKDKSKIVFNMANSFSSSYGASFGRYVLKINGTQVYSGTSTSYTMTTPLASTSSNYQLIVYDARGKYKESAVTNISALDYSKPTITKLEVNRLNSPTTTAAVKFSASITSLSSKNTKNFKVQYKEKSSSTWTTFKTYTSNYSYTDEVCNVTNLDDSKTYDIRISATDFYETITSDTSLGTTFTLINFNAKGTSMAIGKASEKDDTFEVNMNTDIIGTLSLNGSSIFDVIYPVGSIYINTDNTNPSTLFGGTWEMLRVYNGGELLAWAVQEVSSGNTTLLSDTVYAWNDPALSTNKSAVVENYIDGILTDKGGAIWVDPKGIVGMVEAVCTLSGLGYSGIRGIWWQKNANTLPSGVSIYPKGSGHLQGSPIDNNYGGNSTNYKYKVDSGTTDGFYVNPNFKPYNGNFSPCNGATTSSLQVKAYARIGNTYMWKRTA